jgi:hypothetical protein
VVQPDGSTGGQPDGYRLGVLFVHGIGEQQQYSTLARFGGALQRWLRQWEDGRQLDQPKQDRVARPAVVDVPAVDAHPGDRKDPAHAEMAVGSGRKWLLAEAWWAPEVTPPKFKDFITWVLPMFPWLAAEYAVAAGQRIYRPDPAPSLHGRDPTWVERWSLAGLVWLASPLIAVVLMVVCLLLALLQRLPVVGKRVSALTVNLVKGVGDSYLFAHDALARTAMVQRIRHDLDWLRAKGCERVVIVAHSQGAALCHDMLRDDNRPKDVDLLVTVGSGVQRLNEFRQLYRDAALRSIGWRSIGAMVALAAGMVLVVGALGPGVPGLWTWSGVALVVAGALFPGMYNARGAASKSGPTPDNEADLTRGGVVWGTALGCAGAVALAVSGLLAGGPAGPRLLGGAVLLGLGIFGYAVAYRMVEARLETPPQLALPRDGFNLRDDRKEQPRWVHWVDYYSSADPVPNGPLVTWRDDGPPTQLDPEDHAAVHPWPRLVYNLRSVQADHSFYFDNADEFLPQLALDLAAKAGQSLGPLQGRADLLSARAARRWRTACRSDLRNLLLGGGLLGALAVSLRLGGGGGWAQLGADLGVRSQSDYGLVGQLSRSVLTWLAKLPFLAGLKTLDLQVFSGLLVAAVAVAGGAIALGWLWSMWDRHGIARFFQQHQAERVGSGALEVALRRAPMVAFLTLAGLLLAGTAAAAQRYAGAWWLWLAFLLAGGFTACLTVLRWRTCLGRARTRRRPPDAPAPPSRPARSDPAPPSPTRPRSAHPEDAKA